MHGQSELDWVSVWKKKKKKKMLVFKVAIFVCVGEGWVVVMVVCVGGSVGVLMRFEW